MRIARDVDMLLLIATNFARRSLRRCGCNLKGAKLISVRSSHIHDGLARGVLVIPAQGRCEIEPPYGALLLLVSELTDSPVKICTR